MSTLDCCERRGRLDDFGIANIRADEASSEKRSEGLRVGVFDRFREWPKPVLDENVAVVLDIPEISQFRFREF